MATNTTNRTNGDTSVTGAAQTGGRLTSAELRAMLEAEDAVTRKTRRQQEGTLQARCVRIFRTLFPMLSEYMTHMKNEEPDERRRKISASMGVVPGYPDLMLFVPSRYGRERVYHGLALELKNGRKGTQGVNQKLCQMRMEACGYRYEIVRDADEFREVTSDYVSHIPSDLIDALRDVGTKILDVRAAEAQKRDRAAVSRARKELEVLRVKSKE